MAAKMDTSADGEQEIDESLYSRQLYVLGHETMRRMAGSNVLICGMKGLGVEIAKNIVLAGVKSVDLYDPEPVEIADLSTQFFLKSDDVGKNRAEATLPRLKELNSYVSVGVCSEELSAKVLDKYQVVVLTNSTTKEQLAVNDIAHPKGIAYINASTKGLFGQIFCDFGKEFTITDANGQDPASVMISVISQDGAVTSLDQTRHGMETGDHVTFREVEGMTGLNGVPPLPIKVISPYSFSIGDASKYGEYIKGGIATQVKMPQTCSFKSLRESLSDPDFFIAQFDKMDRPAQMHAAFQAANIFRETKGRWPNAGDATDAAEVIEITKTVNSQAKDKVELDEKLITLFAKQCIGNVAALDAVIGGITAQEVIKACSGKYTPIKQYMYFDSIESLAEEGELAADDVKPVGSRYDAQIAVFGKRFQEKLAAQKYFLVGSGAIGCELLKNFALLGLGCGPQGKLYVTDMDTIEKSNLNRQFLFRSWNVGQLKSECAANAARSMNPELNITAHQNRVGPNSEDIYDDEFFSSLDGVANALDNVEARQYMDRRCVYYNKALFESGTMGTMGNTQVVLPHLTESYSSSQDPPEKSIPICTLKNFPSKIEHTIQWARDVFEGTFTQSAESVNQYLKQDNFVQQLMKLPGSEPYDTLASIEEALVLYQPVTFDDCVKWARIKFQQHFFDNISQLLHNFPPDQVTSSGQPFWSGAKRCPKPVIFDPENDLHLDFVIAAANLRAFNFSIQGGYDRAQFKEAVRHVEVPKFVPRSGVKIETDDKKAEEEARKVIADAGSLEETLKRIPAPSSFTGFQLKPCEFEKDDDSNFHMDFITACSNLRASNYDIEAADKHHTKRIAGKIIPAIATTTALVAGLVTLEICKLVNGNKKLESYSNGFINLALPYLGFSDPQPCIKSTYNGKEWTLWDRFTVQGEMTLQEFIDYFQDKENLEVNMISEGVTILYSFFMNKDKLKARLKMTMSQIVEEIRKNPLPAHQTVLLFDLNCDDESGEDVEVPYVVYKRGK